VFRGLPVGALAQPGEPDEKSFRNLAGLFVPLVSQGERMGAIVIQAAQKSQFNQGEVAMLQAFANQAAVALQRAVLVENLRKKIDALEAAQAGLAEKERIERELELARQVQQSVLPQQLPEIPGYRFLARCEAARQVGGDFFDVIDLDEEHFGLAVADVSDKGMPAAMYMVLTRSLLVAQSQVERSPAKVLRSVNHLLHRLSTASMFVTVFYGVVHRPSGRLCYARAGHDRPVLHHQNQAQELPGDGIALGVQDDAHFLVDEVEVQLSSGDRLVLYTDGLCDVLNPNQELFGRTNLLHLLQKTVHQPLVQAGKEIFQSLRHFQSSADQFDDMTLLMMDVIER
jgi:serine phosphatase RsbU (regulator of sigma subunit)